jgi:hypothetical protein
MSPKRKAVAGPVDTFAYWLMPHGLRGLLTTIFWTPVIARTAGRGKSRAPRVRRSRRAGALSPYLGVRPPFPILAPGKLATGVERVVGEHTFWRGELWGRTVALQGDSSFTKYDLFEIAGSRLLYWGTFRGNGYYGSEESHSFSSPVLWMERMMSVGEFKETRITDNVFDPQLRQLRNSGDTTLRVQIIAHHDTFRDPDSGLEYSDVLEVHYWSRYPDASSLEVYHLGRGLGTIRFETFNRLEPSGVHFQFAERFETFSPTDTPTLPWLDPFQNRTYVHNGFCQDFLRLPAQGGAVGEYLRDWSGSVDAVITTDGGDEGFSPWKIALRGLTGGGDDAADFVISSDWIPVTPGRRYRLSGSLWRVSADDNVYLDFNDGIGQGGNFEDAQALSTRIEVWERVSREATVGPETTAIKIRCVRDGANRGNAYCDGITLQRVN